LDIDIIVQCDIKELWNIDFYYQGKEYALAANKGASLTCNYEHYERFKKLNLSPDHLYFNSGILVINCDKWRKDNIFRELLKVAKKIKFKLIAADQDILNIYFDCNNYVHFSGSYNNAPDYNEVCANYNPKILHYASTKPWIECNTFKSENFWAVARRTPYYEQILYKFINKEWNNARKITITTEPKLFAAWVRSKSEEKNKL
jgi:lipopolysaccharide biosynthesis glycosyltransferase